MATISHELYLKAANGRGDMKRRSAATLAVAAVAGWVLLIPAYAAPPTVTPSPGYDARLQEQRAASRTNSEPVEYELSSDARNTIIFATSSG